MWTSSHFPEYSKCCCCISLQIGSYLIGILHLLSGVGITITTYYDEQENCNRSICVSWVIELNRAFFLPVRTMYIAYIFGGFFILLAVLLLLGLIIAKKIVRMTREWSERYLKVFLYCYRNIFYCWRCTLCWKCFVYSSEFS